MLLQRATKETDCGNVLEGQQPEHRSGVGGGDRRTSWKDPERGGNAGPTTSQSHRLDS